uniref:DUF2442 domain-containing protein n=1 Tax=Halomonas sp. TaxID=1486246 RepID=UPI00261C5701|nr:DUF2442 domain-containing protein [Halomonas sp.]
MQIQAAAKQDSTAGITPAVIKWRVRSVEVKDHLSLWVTFSDDTQGPVTISSEWLTGVLSDLKKPEVFKTAFVEHGAVTWENGVDLDPKAMYDAIRANGQYHIE